MHQFQRDFLEQPSESDKLKHHGYHRIYPWFLAHFRNIPVNLLEIGLYQSESLKLWKSYFSDIHLYGIDIKEKDFNEENVQIFKVDQSSARELDEFVEKVPVDFSIIVDDGSHIPEHQILTLKKLWKKLLPGGVYIIEDIETSYWGKSVLFDYKFDANRINIVEQIQKGISFVNWEFTGTKLRKKLSAQSLASILKEAEIISFAYNCLILVKKDQESFGEFYRDKYVWKKHIEKRSWNRGINRRLESYKKKYFSGK